MTNRNQIRHDPRVGVAQRTPTAGHATMQRRIRSLLLVVPALMLGTAGCEFLDPRGVTNPTITEQTSCAPRARPPSGSPAPSGSSPRP